MSRLLQEKNVRLAFEVSLVLKAAFALVEIAAGIGIYFVTRQFVLNLVEHLTREELLEDPRDLVANYLFRSAQHFSLSARNFTAIYLLIHGALKLWLIAGLLRAKLAYYPAAIAVFGIFIVYQVYRFSLTHSPWLMAVTVVDVLVVGLTWHEYRHRRLDRGGCS